jgi:DNA replication protein DnaC
VDGRRCECHVRKRIAEKLERLDRRYAKFARFDLMSLSADESRHAKQAELIPTIQADPKMSLLLFGGTGTGKTLIGYVMAKHAIAQGRPVVAVTLAELLDQYRAQSFDAERLPIVDAETLREAEGRYLIFVDEMDKARPTEFAGEKLFQLVNAIYETEQQVVVASNLPKPNLMAHWERAGQSGQGVEFSQYGAPILRRLCELENSLEAHFF